jgi:hypothetical protein
MAGASSSSAGGSGAAASAGAGGGVSGGGVSATTLGIVGAAAGGGLIATRQLTGSSGPTYSGPFTGNIPTTFGSCTRNEAHQGTFSVEMDEDDATAAHADLRMDITVTQGTCAPSSANNRREQLGFDDHVVSRTGEQLVLNRTWTNSMPPPDVWTVVYSFTGSRSGNQITGTLTIAQEVGAALGTPGNGRGSITHQVTLTLE